MVLIRKATLLDKESIVDLYRTVAQVSQGIARMEDEITEQYVDSLFATIETHGLMLVAIGPTNQLIAEIHASKYGLRIFDHILTGLTIAVHPDYQGKGIGKRFFRLSLTKYNKPFPR